MPSGPTVLFTRAVVPPQGEARSEIDIALPLLDKMARRQAVARHLLPWRSQREFNTYLLDDCGIRIEDLERTGYHQLGAGPPTPRPFATPTGKIELFSTVMEEAGLDPLPSYTPPSRERFPQDTAKRFPLILITGDREKSYHHSRFRDQPWALKVSPDPRLTMHPDTARSMGLEDGAWVHLEVAGGKGPCRLRISFGCTPPTSTPAWLVAAIRSGPRARRPRRQHQRRARPRRPLGPVAPPTSVACRAGWSWRRDLRARLGAAMQRHPAQGGSTQSREHAIVGCPPCAEARLVLEARFDTTRA